MGRRSSLQVVLVGHKVVEDASPILTTIHGGGLSLSRFFDIRRVHEHALGAVNVEAGGHPKALAVVTGSINHVERVTHRALMMIPKRRRLNRKNLRLKLRRKNNRKSPDNNNILYYPIQDFILIEVQVVLQHFYRFYIPVPENILLLKHPAGMHKYKLFIITVLYIL